MRPREDLPVVSMGMIEDADGRVLICRRASTNADGSPWELPAAVARRRESPEAAMRRAAREGVALSVAIAIGQPPFRDEYDGRVAIYRFFVCRRTAGEARASLPYSELRWIEPGQLIEYEYRPPVQSIVNWYVE